jgi:microcystin-dependent protein
MAQYPSGTPNFTTKINGDVIQPNHINDLQAEINAIGNALLAGIPHALVPDLTNTRDLGTATKKWRDLHAAGTLHASAGDFSGSVNVVGNITAGGNIQAGTVSGSFVGDASGLVGVPAGDKALSQLTDVSIISPTTGQVLTWNSTLGKWENQASAGGGGGVSLPVGSMTMFAGPAIPSGWLLCDGQAVSRTTYIDLFNVIGGYYGAGDGSTTFNVPNLTQRFPIGVSAATPLANAGGQWDHAHAVPAHYHLPGSLAVAAHSHDGGTLTVGSHTHSAGSYSIASHSHTLSAGTVSTVGSHDHYVNQHTHTFSGQTATKTGQSVGTGGFGDPAAAETSHTHAYSGTTANSSSSLRTDTNGGHSHTLSGSTGTAAPGLSGTSGASTAGLTGNTGSVAPAITGATDWAAAVGTDARNPPWIGLNFIIKT